MNTQTHERIDSLDLIRGIAILAIPILSIYAMALPPVAHWVPPGTRGAAPWIWRTTPFRYSS